MANGILCVGPKLRHHFSKTMGLKDRVVAETVAPPRLATDGAFAAADFNPFLTRRGQH